MGKPQRVGRYGQETPWRQKKIVPLLEGIFLVEIWNFSDFNILGRIFESQHLPERTVSSTTASVQGQHENAPPSNGPKSIVLRDRGMFPPRTMNRSCGLALNPPLERPASEWNRQKTLGPRRRPWKLPIEGKRFWCRRQSAVERSLLFPVYLPVTFRIKVNLSIHNADWVPDTGQVETSESAAKEPIIIYLTG